MLSNKKICLIVSALAVCAMVSVLIVHDYLKTRSSAQLNIILEKVKVGIPISEAIKNLGQPSRVLTEAKDVEEWGTIKDKKVIEKCDLYMFPYWGMPHKYIFVYVNKDSNEVGIVKVESM